MKHTVATPKTLSESIIQGLIEGGLDTEAKIREDNQFLIKSLAICMQDYLAQKFGAAMIVADDEEAKRLKVLFERIIQKESK